MTFSKENPPLREYHLLVKPPHQNKIKHRIYAPTASEAKKEALVRWPESLVIVTNVKK